MLLVIVAHQLLIQREIDLVGSDGALIIFGHIDFVGDFFQRGKILLDRLIHQNVPVSQVKNLPLHTALQHPVHNLKSGIGFACSCCHNE